MIEKMIRALLVASSVMLTLPSIAGAASNVYVVEQAKAAQTVRVGGTVIPYKQVTFSAQIPGRVREIAGIEGDRFPKGALLVAMDDSALIAKRNAAIAQLRNAEAQLRNASVQYTREIYAPRSKKAPGGMGLPNLFDQMFTKPMGDFMGESDPGAERSADLYSSRTAIDQARNAILQAQAQIQAIDAKLRDAKSIAPFDGVILKKYVEVGDTVQPGQPLLNFGDVEYLQVDVDVPSRLRKVLRDGQMLKAEIGPTNRIVPVRVAQVFPMADAQRHTVKVKFDLPQGVSAPGEYVRVLIPDTTTSSSLPVVPASAIHYNGSLPGIYVLGPDGKPSLRMVRVGQDLGNGFVTILSGIKAGDRVLVDNDGRQPRANDAEWTGGRHR